MSSGLQTLNVFLSFVLAGVIAVGLFVIYGVYKENVKRLNACTDSQMVKPHKVRFVFSWLIYGLTSLVPAVLLLWLFQKEFPYIFTWLMPLLFLSLAPSAYPYYIVAVHNDRINGATRWGWLWKRTEIRLDDIDIDRIARQSIGIKLGVTVIHSKSGTKILTLGLDEKQLDGILDSVNKGENPVP